MVLTFVSRSEWLAAEPDDPSKIEPLELPVSQVVEDWWCPKMFKKKPWWEACKSEEECAQRVRDIQALHLKQGWGDINYNFLICQDLRVYECRGWDKQIWEDPSRGINVGYVGVWSKAGDGLGPVTEPMKKVFEELVEYGKEHNYIKPNCNILKWNFD